MQYGIKWAGLARTTGGVTINHPSSEYTEGSADSCSEMEVSVLFRDADIGTAGET